MRMREAMLSYHEPKVRDIDEQKKYGSAPRNKKKPMVRAFVGSYMSLVKVAH